ncbi:unnamed protein product [Rotaria sp. Silwood2]|nr:unnamed protein product [Rotaria sp. Silwood2]CAF4693995.1 unnamed protein product [Rotaria sp. Silwood2]
MKKYYPILISKQGELTAIQHLTQDVKDNICPVIEILEEILEKKIRLTKGMPKDTPRQKKYNDLLEKTLYTHWSFDGNKIIFDFTYFNFANGKFEVIKNVINSLLARKVNIIFAVQSNSEAQYLDSVKEWIKKYKINVCIRISRTIGNGFDGCNKDASELLERLNISSRNVMLLIDLGYANKDNFDLLFSTAKYATLLLTQKKKDWMGIIISSGSFPKDLSEFKTPNSVYTIKRYEWSIWEKIKKDEDFPLIKYGDYGTKYPIYEDAGYAGTISIRYTVDGNFFIYKGQKTDLHTDGHGQYISHCKKLTATEDYFGKDFSWGDMKIDEISKETIKNNKLVTGSAGTWVSISQNHHITHLHEIL